MNSRERVLTALSHREPDRVPVDLGSSPVTGLAATVYQEIKHHFGIPGPTLVDVGQQLAYFEDDVSDRLGTDVRRVGPMPRKWKEWTFADGFTGLVNAELNLIAHPDGSQELRTAEGPHYSMPPGGWFFDVLDDTRPLREASTPADIERFFASLPPKASQEESDYAFAEVQRRKAENRHALFGYFPVGAFESWYYRGFDVFLTDLLAEPELATALMRCFGRHHLEYWRPVLERIGPELDVVYTSDDLGSQHGLLASEDTYCELVKPIHRELWADLKKLAPNAKLFFHCCGAVEPLIPHFIEVGVDCLNPVQLSAKGMDPVLLKQRYGNEIAFWGGGVDTQSVMQRGTPQQVKEDVRRHLDIMAPGGGFVFATVHNIQPATPVDNVLALFEALEEFRRY